MVIKIYSQDLLITVYQDISVCYTAINQLKDVLNKLLRCCVMFPPLASYLNVPINVDGQNSHSTSI